MIAVIRTLQSQLPSMKLFITDEQSSMEEGPMRAATDPRTIHLTLSATTSKFT